MMLFIVKFYDEDVNEDTEMEFGNERHASEMYQTLEGQDGVKNLRIESYDFKTKQYMKVR